jgi:hypothetical protein
MTDDAEVQMLLACMKPATRHALGILADGRIATSAERAGIFVTCLRRALAGKGLLDAYGWLLQPEDWADIGRYEPTGAHFIFVHRKPWSRQRIRRRIMDLTPKEIDMLTQSQARELANLSRELTEQEPHLQLQSSFDSARQSVLAIRSLAAEAKAINDRADEVIGGLCNLAESLK